MAEMVSPGFDVQISYTVDESELFQNSPFPERGVCDWLDALHTKQLRRIGNLGLHFVFITANVIDEKISLRYNLKIVSNLLWIVRNPIKILHVAHFFVDVLLVVLGHPPAEIVLNLMRQ